MKLRTVGIVSGLLLTSGALLAIKEFDVSKAPEERALEELGAPSPDLQLVCDLYRESVRQNPANAYLWADLATALQKTGNSEQARKALERAVALGGETPQLRLRAANFYLAQGDTSAALSVAALVLSQVADYDQVIFGGLDAAGAEASQVLDAMAGEPRSTRAYLRFLIAQGKARTALHVWPQVRAKGLADDKLVAEFTSGLLNEKAYDEADQLWREATGNRSELLQNGDLEKEPSGGLMDWKLEPGEVETVRDNAGALSGSYCLRIRFQGDSNTSYVNAMQRVRILPGNYTLQAWVRTDQITTNEGPRLLVADAESQDRLRVVTDSFTGTLPWTEVKVSFRVPQGTNVICLGVTRLPSAKFDNKIAGTFWMDHVSLVKN